MHIPKRIALLFLPTLIFAGCEAGLDGTPKENQPPSTSFTVNSINLPEGERLTSQISISWWGDDADGFVEGYEFYIGENPDQQQDGWVFTTSTDSTFILPIEEGELDADVRFTVRAVDNEGLRDPQPPSLVFPIRNSAPTAEFVANEIPPDTTYRVFSFGFRVNDPDGAANLNRIEFAINDTSEAASWIALDPAIQLLTFRIDDTQPGNPTQVFTGRNAISTEFQINTIETDAENTFYLRSIDNAGSVSAVRDYTWYVKRQQSNILFLNDFSGPDSQARANLHIGLLASVGITNFDYIDITDGLATGGRRVVLSQAFPNRALVVPTTNMMLAEWDHIYWISQDLDRNIGYALEMTLDFFTGGGTMFVNIPTKTVPDDNPALEFLPFERIQASPPGAPFFIAANTTMNPTAAMQNLVNSPETSTTEIPYLRFVRNQAGNLFPVVPFGQTVELYEAEFQTRRLFPPSTTPYDGPLGVTASSPENNLLYFGVDYHQFVDPDPDSELPQSDLTGLTRLLIIDILNFEQR